MRSGTWRDPPAATWHVVERGRRMPPFPPLTYALIKSQCQFAGLWDGEVKITVCPATVSFKYFCMFYSKHTAWDFITENKPGPDLPDFSHSKSFVYFNYWKK